LYSTRVEQVQYARQHYKPRTTEMTTLFYDLLQMHSEDPAMSEALKEFAREVYQEMLKDMPLEKRLEGLSPKQRLEGLSQEELQTILEEAQRKLQANDSSTKPQ